MMHGQWIEEGQEWRWMTKELAILEVQEKDSGSLGTMVEMEKKNEREKRGKIITVDSG